ncbi:MAG: hypothetical protein QM660_09755 [Dysgonomonas sp.]
MKEKVYTIPSIWDMTILEGVADYKGYPHHFCILDPEDGEDGFFSDKYKLILLTYEIFDLEMKSWAHWLHWLDMSQKGIHIPHSVDYAKARKEISYEQVNFDNCHFTQQEKELAEQNYQSELIVKNYLRKAAPLPYQVKGVFQGSTDFSSKTENLFVEWFDLLERNIIE